MQATLIFFLPSTFLFGSLIVDIIALPAICGLDRTQAELLYSMIDELIIKHQFETLK